MKELILLTPATIVVVWALPILGATLIITCSMLFRPFREFWDGRVNKLHELFKCPMCSGFWVGLVASALGHTLVGLQCPLCLRLFSDACAASFICWISHVTLCRLGQGKLLSSRPDLKDQT